MELENLCYTQILIIFEYYGAYDLISSSYDLDSVLEQFQIYENMEEIYLPLMSIRDMLEFLRLLYNLTIEIDPYEYTTFRRLVTNLYEFNENSFEDAILALTNMSGCVKEYKPINLTKFAAGMIQIGYLDRIGFEKMITKLGSLPMFLY